MEKSLLSVVALSWNGKHHLVTCLPSLEAQTYRPIEILLVDNGSTDDTSAYVQANFPNIRIVRLEKNRGVPGGMNAGIAAARGEYIALINNDTEADPAWGAESVAALESHPEAGFIATRMRLFYRRTHLDSAGDIFFRTGMPSKRGYLMRDGPEFDNPAWVFGACAGAAVYRGQMLSRIGYFDEDYQACFEDFDLSFRAQLAGYRCLYVGSAIIYHKLGATVGVGASNPLQEYRAHRNRWFTLIKNLPSPLLLRYLPQMLIADLAVLSSSVRKGRFSNLLRARAEVLSQLPSLMQKRKAMQRLRTEPVDRLDSLILKNWYAHRLQERRREVEAAAVQG